jgi:hypothetical protein
MKGTNMTKAEKGGHDYLCEFFTLKVFAYYGGHGGAIAHYPNSQWLILRYIFNVWRMHWKERSSMVCLLF